MHKTILSVVSGYTFSICCVNCSRTLRLCNLCVCMCVCVGGGGKKDATLHLHVNMHTNSTHKCTLTQPQTHTLMNTHQCCVILTGWTAVVVVCMQTSLTGDVSSTNVIPGRKEGRKRGTHGEGVMNVQRVGGGGMREGQSEEERKGGIKGE